MAGEPPKIRTVAVARPLGDVVFLRVAAVARSAEDVSRLVELLGPPEPGVGRTGEVGRPATLWLRRFVAVLVLLCGAAHFPLDWIDAPRYGLAASLGISALSLAAGAALWFSRSRAVAAATVLAPGALAAAHLLGAHADSAALAYVRQAGGAVSPLPAFAALVATLAVPTVLVVPLARRQRVSPARVEPLPPLPRP